MADINLTEFFINIRESFLQIAHDVNELYERSVNGFTRLLPAINPLDHEADPTGELDSTTAFNLAIAEAATKGRNVKFPAGTFLMNPTQINVGNISILGEPGYKTKIKRSGVRGPAFHWSVDRVRLQDLDIDCDESDIEGAVYFSGKHSTVRRVRAFKGDKFSIVCSSVVFDGGGVTTPTQHNLIDECITEGQKSFGGEDDKATFMICDGAEDTQVRNCLGVDNNADYFGADNARRTKFTNPKGIKSGAQSSFAGLHAEGDQEITQTFVTGADFSNLLSGITNGESAYLSIKDSFISLCKFAVKGINNLQRIDSDNVEAYQCGNGLATDDTNGVFGASGPATWNNCKDKESYAKNSGCNYSPTTKIADVTKFVNCDFEKFIRAWYSDDPNAGGGVQEVVVDSCILRGSGLIWYNGMSTSVFVTDTVFLNAQVHLGRISRALFKGCKFKSTVNTNYAFDYTLDNANTFISETDFEGWAGICANNNVLSFGPMVTERNNTNPRPAVSQDPLSYVQGTIQSRIKVITTVNADLPSGPYCVAGVPGVTGMPSDPAGYNVWVGDILREDNGTTTGMAGTVGGAYWSKQEFTNLIGTKRVFRSRNGITQTFGAWEELPSYGWKILAKNFAGTPGEGKIVRLILDTGVLVPTWVDDTSIKKTTAEIAAIVSPALAQRYYDTTLNKEVVYDGTTWQPLW